jgi:hypothetical protein
MQKWDRPKQTLKKRNNASNKVGEHCRGKYAMKFSEVQFTATAEDLQVQLDYF